MLRAELAEDAGTPTLGLRAHKRWPALSVSGGITSRATNSASRTLTRRAKGHRTNRRRLFSPRELSRYLREWLASIRDSDRRNRRLPRDLRLGTPKLSADATECLVVLMINAGILRGVLPEVVSAVRGRGTRNQPDIYGTTLILGHPVDPVSIEVKGTGRCRWSRASALDAAAYAAIWIDLSPLCRGSQTARVWVLRAPGRFLPEGTDWRSEADFRRITQGNARLVRVPLSAIGVAWTPEAPRDTQHPGGNSGAA